MIIVFRSLVIASFQIFFPAFVASLGGSLFYGSLALTVYEIGGLLALCAGPVQLALVQELFPNNRSMATGIVMFLGYEGQVFAAIGIGLVADRIGIQSALAWSVLASMLSLPFTLLLPETRGGRSGAL